MQAQRLKVKAKWMNGGRVDGYYYVGIEGTDLIVCEDGHPDFPVKFREGTKNAKAKAQKLAREINKEQLQVLITDD